ncbi:MULTISPECIES: GTP cyclohydrolase II [Streptomyces]|uniref:GTP cyclohydrolase II n=1 Tax=Streptomyces TaxID=1883 RepID=UPI000B2852B1|nr:MULTISPECIES: GTP cyclohydrolase II [Streptomyces]
MTDALKGEDTHPRIAEAGGEQGGAGIRARVNVPLRLKNDSGETAKIVSFRGLSDGLEHVAIEFGAVADIPLVRLHSECLTGDVFGSTRCDCGPQLQESLELLSVSGGILLYLRQEGRGIGLYNKLDAYWLQQHRGLDTFAANRKLNFSDDLRDYRPAAQMLQALGVPRVRLLSNNPDKSEQLRRYGIDVVDVVPTGVFPNERNIRYLRAKVEQHGHSIEITQEFA